MEQAWIKSFNKTHGATCAELNTLVSRVVKATVTGKAQDWLAACVPLDHWNDSWLLSLLSTVSFNTGDHLFRESYLSPNSGNINSCTMCWKVFVSYLLLCSLLMKTFIMLYVKFPTIITCATNSSFNFRLLANICDNTLFNLRKTVNKLWKSVTFLHLSTKVPINKRGCDIQSDRKHTLLFDWYWHVQHKKIKTRHA